MILNLKKSLFYKQAIRNNLDIVLLILSIVIIFVSIPASSFSLARQDNDNLHSKNTPSAVKLPKFVDQTLQAGLSFQHRQGGKTLTSLNEVIGAGACAFDYDNDGWIDLFLVNGSGQTRFYGKKHWWHQSKGNALYRNLGNNQFINVTESSGLKKTVWGMGCVTGDFNNDDYADLLVTTNGKNLLYKNMGDGQFVDVTEFSQITGNEWSTSATLADYNGDGLLDIYIANYIRFKQGAHTYEANSHFGIDTKLAFNPALFDPVENKLYRNLGNFKFQDVTNEAKVGNAAGRSLDARWIDANNDLRPDILVSNDAASSNMLFINQVNGTFSKAGIDFGFKTAFGYAGLSLGDIDNDGDLEIAMAGNNRHPPLLLIQANLQNDTVGKIYRNKLRFNDYARSSGIGEEINTGYRGWSSGLYDFNNDGWLDLFIANGLTNLDPDSKKVSVGQAKQLWINSGHRGKLTSGLRVFNKLENSPALFDTQSARGSVFADFDNDGDIDIYVAHNNDLGQFLVNNSPKQHWLGLLLKGNKIQGSNNRDAIGSRVWLRTSDGSQFRALTSGNGFLSDSDRRLHFGLADQKNVEKLIIQWPDFSKTEYLNPPIDRYLTITQGGPITETKTLELTYKNTPRPLQLTIAKKDAKSRIHYLGWLITEVGIELAMSEIEASLSDKNPKIRAKVLQLLTTYKTKDTLKLVLGSLNDETPMVTIAAVRTLQAYEEEISIRWLMRVFKHSDVDVKIALARCFEFFYSEEEAVVFRKYLALPHLIHLLNDPMATIRMAAARALGSAEKYRALIPLIQRLVDPVADVRSEAARALGLLREREAIAALLELLEDNRQPPKVLASTLIALARLDDKELPSRLPTLINQSSTRGLLTISEIVFNSQDGVAFDYKSLRNIVKPFVNDRADEIRKIALPILINFYPNPRGQYISNGLNDSSVPVRSAVLEVIRKLNLAVPSNLLLKQLSKPDIAIAAIKMLSKYSNNKVIKTLFLLANDPRTAIATRIEALKTLSKIKGKLPIISKNLLNNRNYKLREASIHYWGHRNQLRFSKIIPTELKKQLLNYNDNSKTKPSVQSYAAVDVLIKSNDPWATKQLLRIINQPLSAIELRRYIINNLDEAASTQSVRILLAQVRKQNSPDRLLAMKTLVNRKNLKLETLMWKFLVDKNEEDGIRFLAAMALQPRHGKDVIKILQKDNNSGTSSDSYL